MNITTYATGSKGNFYTIESNGEKLLLECGIAWKNILKSLGFSLSDVVGCLCTHIHHDHNKAIKDVISNGIDVYASIPTFEGLEGTRVHHIKHLDRFKIGSFEIIAIESKHDCEGSLGFIIKIEGKSILFLTDSYYCPYKIDNLDHIMIECNYDDDLIPTLPPYEVRLLKSHMSLNTCKHTLESLNLSKCKTITLIHLSSRHGDKDKFKKEIEELTGIKTYIAEPGLIVEG